METFGLVDWQPLASGNGLISFVLSRWLLYKEGLVLHDGHAHLSVRAR